MNKVIIWGLRNRKHSHKFIHNGFYENFKNMGFETLWLEDEKTNASLVKPGDIILAVDVASEHLPVVKKAKYILHNLAPERLGITKDYLILQVHTKNVPGTNMGTPWATWDKENSTLYQPWGVPTDFSEWLTYSPKKSRNEYWVGSVWNNSLNQGNQYFISNYIAALKQRDIKFKKKGNSTFLNKFGISEQEAQALINISPVGAAVVGEWQKEFSYIPCRFFKNISAGAFPCSNADFSELLGSSGGLFHSDPASLIDGVLSLGDRAKLQITKDAQEAIKPYTYTNGIRRILDCL